MKRTYFRCNWVIRIESLNGRKLLMEGRWRVALSPNRPLPQGQDLDKARASVESTADVNSRVSSEQNKAGSVGGFRKGGDELALARAETERVGS